MSKYFHLKLTSSVTFILVGIVLHLADCKQGRKNVDKFAHKMDEFVLGNNDTMIWSPWSVYSAFWTLQKISDGKTAEEFAKLLGPPEEERDRFPAPTTEFNELGWDAALKQASAVFINGNGNHGRNLSSFVMNLENVHLYNNSIEINSWMSNKTDGLISHIVDDRMSSKMIVTTAVVFKGKWKSPFKLSDKKSFKGLHGDFQVDYLFKRTTEDYGEFGVFRVLKLGYKDSGLKIFFILPQSNDNLPGLFRIIKGHFGDILLRLEPTELDVYLPKAKIVSGIDLKSALIKAGLKTAFDPMKANFTKIFETDDDKIYLESVIHKTVLELDEQGTKAASATAAVLTPLSSIFVDVKKFSLDRPFILMVTDGKHVAFEGIIYDLDDQNEYPKLDERIHNDPLKFTTIAPKTVGKIPNDKKKKFHGEPIISSNSSPTFPERYQQPEPKDPHGIRFPSAKDESFHGVKLPQFFQQKP